MELKTLHLQLSSFEKGFFEECTEEQTDVEGIVNVDIHTVDETDDLAPELYMFVEKRIVCCPV